MSGTIFHGGMVVDGTGALPFRADVFVDDGRILFVGDSIEATKVLADRAAATRIDCSGLVIAPGFIDAHSHSDLQVLDGRTEKLLQGVTSEVVGNCGFSPYPCSTDARELRSFANGILCGDEHWGWRSAGDYLAEAEGAPVATVRSLVGHGSLRLSAIGPSSRQLTQMELGIMCAKLDEMLQQGAIGLSSGLMYAPGSGASIEELTALCKVVAKHGGVYATHMRSYSSGLLAAVEEQLEIARRSGVRLQISHLQAVGKKTWPLQQQAIALLEAAATQGVQVQFDAYPWLAGSTVLTQLLPQSALDGGTAKLLERLKDPSQRGAIEVEVELEHGDRWGDLVISSVASNDVNLVGQTIADIAAQRACKPQTIVTEILLRQNGQASILEHNQSTENLRALLTHPLCMVVTDGLYTHGRPHPRLYGTFPLLLGDIARTRGWMKLEKAIEKITSQPADTFNLQWRGRIQRAFVADIAVFDPGQVDSGATYEVPATPPKGIELVMRAGHIQFATARIHAAMA